MCCFIDEIGERLQCDTTIFVCQLVDLVAFVIFAGRQTPTLTLLSLTCKNVLLLLLLLIIVSLSSVRLNIFVKLKNGLKYHSVRMCDAVTDCCFHMYTYVCVGG